MVLGVFSEVGFWCEAECCSSTSLFDLKLLYYLALQTQNQDFRLLLLYVMPALVFYVT